MFLEISQNSQENTCPRDSCFNKVAGLRPATLLKRFSGTGVFLWIFAKFIRTPFFTQHLRWLLLALVAFWTSYVLSVYVLRPGGVDIITCIHMLMIYLFSFTFNYYSFHSFIYFFLIYLLCHCRFNLFIIYFFNRLINHFCWINSAYTHVESDQNLFISLMYTGSWLIIQHFFQNI